MGKLTNQTGNTKKRLTCPYLAKANITTLIKITNYSENEEQYAFLSGIDKLLYENNNSCKGENQGDHLNKKYNMLHKAILQLIEPKFKGQFYNYKVL